jgi:holin-like protein
MRRTLRTGLRLAAQAALLWLLSELGTLLVQTLGLPLPGGLLGMVLLLGLLSTGVVRPADLEELTGPVLRHMPLLFVPLAVGAVAWGGQVAAHQVVLAASLLASTVLGLLASGAGAQAVARLRKRHHGP